MSEPPAQNPRRIQFDVSGLLILMTVSAVVVAIGRSDPELWWMWIVYLVIPFPIGFAVGKRSNSRAELLRSVPVAAALAPLPLLLYGAFATNSPDRPPLEFVRFWVMLFPVLLIFGAPAALAGSALAYWLNRRRGRSHG